MNDSVNTPRESLEVARNAIIDLHALLKIMDGATSIQPSASDWGELFVPKLDPSPSGCRDLAARYASQGL